MNGPAYLLDVRRTRARCLAEGKPGTVATGRVALALYALERHQGAGVYKVGLADKMVPPAYAHELHAILRAGLDRLGGTLAVTGDVLHSA